jgi:hypothetical protein
MALTKFVKNCTDLSDDGGFKFRFPCDHCGDGFESQYVSSSSNLLKTAIDAFNIFRPIGGLGNAADSIDRGLRGKERDAAYETAVHEAMSFFKKCSACGNWVCPEHCWNNDSGMCEGCAPNATEEAAKEAAQLKKTQEVDKVRTGGVPTISPVSCAVCGASGQKGEFCEACGAPLASLKTCPKCATPLTPGGKFCGQCGAKS